MSVTDPTPTGSTHPLAVLLDEALAHLIKAGRALDEINHLLFEAGRDAE